MPKNEPVLYGMALLLLVILLGARLLGVTVSDIQAIGVVFAGILVALGIRAKVSPAG